MKDENLFCSIIEQYIFSHKSLRTVLRAMKTQKFKITTLAVIKYQ